jgi:hypothetical protein
MPIKTRDQIIAEWNRPGNTLLAADAPAVPPPADAAPGPEPVDPAAADAKVSQAIATIKSAVGDALTLQQADPDSTDPKDAKVLAGLESLQSLIANIEKDQEADSAANPPPAAAPASDDAAPSDAPAADDKPAPVAAAAVAPVAEGDQQPGGSKGVVGDADDSPPSPGDIEADIICENPECSHVASVHADTEDGNNQGACATPGCPCPGMVPPADVIASPDNPTAGDVAANQGGGPDNAAGTDDDASGPAHATSADAFAVVVPPPGAPDATTPLPDADAPPPPQSGDTLPPLDADPNATLMGPQFTIPVGIIEGLPTGDGRIIDQDALIWRTPPLPLMGLKTEPHDPSGFDPNDPAVLIGRIDYVQRAAGDNGVIQAGGYLLSTDDALEFATIIEQMKKIGVSADVGEAEVDSVLDGLIPELLPGMGDILLGDDDMPEVLDTLVKGTILGFTVCPNAAFADCYIVLGDGSDQPPVTELVDRSAAPAIPPAGATAPTATDEPAPVAASATWRIVSEEDCEPCATGVPLVASAGGGPIAPPMAWFAPNPFAEGSGREHYLRESIDPKTGRSTGKYACPNTITEDGECFGHLAQWGVCHIGPQYRGKCMLAPRSQSDYALWYTGQVLTAEGEMVDTGPLTAGVGHAPDNFSAAAALAHYDNVHNAVANVVVGEDEYGIWYHGAISPSATPEQVFTMRSSSFSGDWRPIGSRLELVAALAVNRPGFPQVKAHRSKGRITSLIAAGAPVFEVPVVMPNLSLDERLDRLERVTVPIAHRALREKMSSLRAG